MPQPLFHRDEKPKQVCKQLSNRIRYAFLNKILCQSYGGSGARPEGRELSDGGWKVQVRDDKVEASRVPCLRDTKEVAGQALVMDCKWVMSLNSLQALLCLSFCLHPGTSTC